MIDQPLIDEFADIQAQQWDDWRPEMTDRIWGLFGENDHLAHFEPLFLQHYTHAYHFPGAHTPTAEEGAVGRKTIYNNPITNEYVKSKTKEIPANALQRTSHRSDA